MMIAIPPDVRKQEEESGDWDATLLRDSNSKLAMIFSLARLKHQNKIVIVVTLIWKCLISFFGHVSKDVDGGFSENFGVKR